MKLLFLFLGLLFVALTATAQNTSNFYNQKEVNILNQAGDLIGFQNFKGEYIVAPENKSVLFISDGIVTRLDIAWVTEKEGADFIAFGLGEEGKEGTLYVHPDYIQRIRNTGDIVIDEKYYFER